MESIKNEDQSIDSLQKQLLSAGIDTSSWGTGKAKTIDDLFNEIREGETVLTKDESGELLRTVVVGSAAVYHKTADGKTYRLKEDRQVFTDGRERRREMVGSVAEKMKPDEDPAEAMVRGIQEELGIEGELEMHEADSYDEVVDSPSYPGLRSKYLHHTFEVSLKDEQYNPDGYVENQPTKSTYFVWEEV